MNDIFMHEKESDFVLSYLGEDKTFFEWGSGGSTLVFPKYVSKYYSIEHDKGWYEKILNELREKNITNVDYHFMPTSIPWERPKGWREIPGYRTPVKLFEKYINIIEDIDPVLDVVLVDGRCRAHCAAKAFPYLKDDGILLFHDFYPRKKFGYHDVFALYENIDGVKDTTQTIAAFKKKGNLSIEKNISLDKISKIFQDYNNGVW